MEQVALLLVPGAGQDRHAQQVVGAVAVADCQNRRLRRVADRVDDQFVPVHRWLPVVAELDEDLALGKPCCLVPCRDWAASVVDNVSARYERPDRLVVFIERKDMFDSVWFCRSVEPCCPRLVCHRWSATRGMQQTDLCTVPCEMVRLDRVCLLMPVIGSQAHAAHLHALPCVEFLPAVPPPGGWLLQAVHNF